MKCIKLLDLFLEQAVLYFLCTSLCENLYVNNYLFFPKVLIAFREIPCVLQFDLQKKLNVYKTVPVEFVKNIVDSVSLV